MSNEKLDRSTSSRASLFWRAVVPALIVCAALLAVAAPQARAETWTLTTLHTFTKTDGAWLYGGLAQGPAGNFFGTTEEGGAHDKGVVYKITPDGTVTVLHSFSGPDGANPETGLVLGADGNLYGTTSQGGTTGISAGTIFKITPTGTLTTVYMFCSMMDDGVCIDGQNPTSPLIEGNDGNLYGTIAGHIFRITSAGDYTVVCTGNAGGGVGEGLVQDSEGNFYGTGHNNSDTAGAVYKCTPTGDFTLLYSFTVDGESGYSPAAAALALGSDGNLYGINTQGGGPNGDGSGTLFKITPTGTLTTLHVFDSLGNEGELFVAPLVAGSDGNLYGVAVNGGAHPGGTIFRVTPSGTFSLLHSFDLVAGEGINPRGPLLETTPGVFYGTTFGGGAGGLLPGKAFGTVYKFTNGNAVQPPPAPNSLRAVADDGAVDLTWAAADGATSYNVYQGTTAGGEAATPVKTGITKTQATIGGLTNGTTYYFTVAGVNDGGTGAHSNEASATPGAAPGQVTGLVATAGDGSVTLTWDSVSGATGYTVNQGTSPGGEKAVAMGVAGTSYTANGLNNGTAYYFTVIATNSAGAGSASAEVTATPAGQAPPPPPPPPDNGGNGGGGGGGAFAPALLLLLGLLVPAIRRRRS